MFLSDLESTSHHLALVLDPVGPVVRMLQVLDSWGGKEEVSREEVLTGPTHALLRMSELSSVVVSVRVFVRFRIVRNDGELALAEGSDRYLLSIRSGRTRQEDSSGDHVSDRGGVDRVEGNVVFVKHCVVFNNSGVCCYSKPESGSISIGF